MLIGATTLVIAPWDYGKWCVGESLLYLALHANPPGKSAGGHGTVDTGLDEPRAPLPEAQNQDREEAGHLARRCSLETWKQFACTCRPVCICASQNATVRWAEKVARLQPM